MKALYKILALVGLGLAFASCTTNLDIHKLDESSNFVAPTLSSPGSIVITAADVAAEKAVTFSWSAAYFGQPTEISYAIIATYGSITNTIFTGLSGKSYDAKSGELSDKLTAMGVPTGSTVNVDFVISSTIGTDFQSVDSKKYSIPVTINQ